MDKREKKSGTEGRRVEERVEESGGEGVREWRRGRRRAEESGGLEGGIEANYCSTTLSPHPGST